jgi:transcriptional regulator with XRE-family HTH domain
MMPKSITRAYSRYSRDAAALLGALIRESRNERKLTAQELADRAGISRGLLQRIEKGNLKCEIGVVFEVATIVGVKLFDVNESALTRYLGQTREKLALLPKSVRKKSKTVRDDF